MLHHNIKNLEEKGIAVKFWKIQPEFIMRTTGSVWNQFLDIGNALIDNNPNNCTCPDCVIKKQLTELAYAHTGVACCPCHHSQNLVAKNLKRGDKFVITNAGVTETTVTMQIDGTNTSRPHST